MASARGPRMLTYRDLLFDVKTVHAGGPDYRSARASGTDGQCGAVAQRASRVHRDYVRAAQALDGLPDVQAWNQGSAGAVSAALAGYGDVRALVFGTYGEASVDVHELLDIAADQAARDTWRFLGVRSSGEARGYYAARLRRSWGVTIVREFARHRVGRVSCVGAPRRRGARAVRAQAAGMREGWDMRSAAEFSAHAGRVSGAFAGQGARRGWPRR